MSVHVCDSFSPSLKGDSLVWKVNRLPSLVGVRKRNEFVSSILTTTETAHSLLPPSHISLTEIEIITSAGGFETLDRFEMEDKKSDVVAKNCKAFRKLGNLTRHTGRTKRKADVASEKLERETIIAEGTRIISCFQPEKERIGDPSALPLTHSLATFIPLSPQ